MNFFRTGLLLALMTGLFIAVGFLLGGNQGMVIAFLFAAGMNLFAYWGSDKMVLSMYGAREIDRASAPGLYNIVEQLVERARLPMPKVYIIDSEQPNAFATGRNPQHAAVAVSTGLLNRLSDEETAGVLAHELTHIKNRDTLTMTITATIAGAIGMLANFGFMFGGRRDSNGNSSPIAGILVMILAPIAAMLVQMAISRSREYAADRGGAEMCGEPLWLAAALEKIHNAAHDIPNREAESNPATAHMFIINPLLGMGMDNLFSTHPNTENRIAALEALSREMAQSAGPVKRRGPWG